MNENLFDENFVREMNKKLILKKKLSVKNQTESLEPLEISEGKRNTKINPITRIYQSFMNTAEENKKRNTRFRNFTVKKQEFQDILKKLNKSIFYKNYKAKKIKSVNPNKNKHRRQSRIMFIGKSNVFIKLN